MSRLWPHLPDAVAAHDFAKIAAGAHSVPASHHPTQIYAPVGDRVSETVIRRFIDDATSLAVLHGYPESAGDGTRISFDRAAALLIHDAMDITWAEGGNRSLWSFTSIVALPHLTFWRFGSGNPERWIASDLTRHTWARLWWRAVVFAEDNDLLNALSESDLNQLLERRSIGGDPRLVRALGRIVVETPTEVATRRALIRDVTARLRRWLAFIDVHALDDRQVEQMCNALTIESVRRLQGEDGRSMSVP